MRSEVVTVTVAKQLFVQQLASINQHSSVPNAWPVAGGPGPGSVMEFMARLSCKTGSNLYKALCQGFLPPAWGVFHSLSRSGNCLRCLPDLNHRKGSKEILQKYAPEREP